METHIQMIQPLVTLVVWSQLMWLWMYATRLPAISAQKMKMDPEAPSGLQMAQLPPSVRWKSDNYNHLMEQPTVFYAVILSLALLGESSDVNIYAAWAYVGLRCIHSLVQALINNIELRFVIFFLSNIPLVVLTFNLANAVIK